MIAWVAIEEQPDIRLTTNLVGVDENDVEIGMPVRVVFEQIGDDVYLPLFAPQASAAGAGESTVEAAAAEAAELEAS